MAQIPLVDLLRKIKEIQAELLRLEKNIIDSISIDHRQRKEDFDGKPSSRNKLQAGQTSSKKRGLPTAVAEAAKIIIATKGRPMTRGEISSALSKQGFDLPPTDPAKYVGTVLWRRSDIFENREGEGYWIKGRRLRRERD